MEAVTSVTEVRQRWMPACMFYEQEGWYDQKE